MQKAGGTRQAQQKTYHFQPAAGEQKTGKGGNIHRAKRTDLFYSQPAAGQQKARGKLAKHGAKRRGTNCNFGPKARKGEISKTPREAQGTKFEFSACHRGAKGQGGTKKQNTARSARSLFRMPFTKPFKPWKGR